VAVHVTDAICIFRTPFGETSQIAHWITPGQGRVACLLKGAFNEKNSYHGNEDLPSLSKVVFSARRGRGLALLRERKLIDHFPGLRRSLRRFSAASLVLESVRWGVQEGQVVPGLFPLLAKTFKALDRCGPECDIILFTFLGGFLKMIGFQPVLKGCVLCGREPVEGTPLFVTPRHGGVVCRNCRSDMRQGVIVSMDAARFVQAAPRMDPLAVEGIRCSEAVGKELWSFFEVFMTYFLEREFKSFAFARRSGSAVPLSGPADGPRGGDH
jgi:DNA repair protein RecO (recombination protein O)